MARFRSGLTERVLPLLQGGFGQAGFNAVRMSIEKTCYRLLVDALGIQSNNEVRFALSQAENDAHEISLLNRYQISEKRFREITENGTLALLRKYKDARQGVFTSQSIEELDRALERYERLLIETGLALEAIQFDLAQSIGEARVRLLGVCKTSPPEMPAVAQFRPRSKK